VTGPMGEPSDETVDPAEDLPEWLHEVRAGAEAIDALDLTRFTPPEDGSARPGAVLMLFGEGEQGGELLLTEREREICARIGPALRERGFVLVGIDVIGDYLTEINVTSPTGVREVQKFGGADIAALFWDAVEKRRQA